MDAPIIQVVAALIEQNGAFLICRRPPHKARGLLWEFVGGKIEPGETPEQALIRECKEELDITLRVGSLYADLIHPYPDMTVRLRLYKAEIAAGTPKLLEHTEIRFITPEQISDFAFCPADEEILRKIGCDAVRARLSALADESYRAFQLKLIPGVPAERVLGVRVPQLRKLAKELAGTYPARAFLSSLPHETYDENNLHGLLIEREKDFARCVALINDFFPYVDNWATCDICSPKCLSKDKPAMLSQIKKWLKSPHLYLRRFAVEMLMRDFLDGDFTPSVLALAAGADSEEYYMHMMVAWFFATALAKQYEAALPYLQTRRLSEKTHRKAIQKACESYRLTDEQKAYLKTLK